MDQLLSALKQKQTLKVSTTKVRQRDGKIFNEQKNTDGIYTQSYCETIENTPSYMVSNVNTNRIEMKHEIYVQSFNIEQWYPILQSLTFETYFIPISIEIALELTNIFKKYYFDPQLKNANEYLQNQIQCENKNILQPFILAINDCMQHQMKISDSSSTDSVFAKLSSRSPKDSTQKKLENIFLTHLSKIETESKTNDNNEECDPSLRTLNDCIILLLQCGFESLKCKNSTEILSNIIRSKRCYYDLVQALKMKETKFEQNLILRKFIPIECENEFRAFVYNHNLVAISQYNYIAKYQTLVDNKHSICQKIVHFWETKCKSLLESKYDKYIIDFAVLENGGIKVIELNPYETDTDALLFDWKCEKDVQILEGNGDGRNGKKSSFEFRVQLDEFHEMWRLLPPHKKLVSLAIDQFKIQLNSE